MKACRDVIFAKCNSDIHRIIGKTWLLSLGLLVTAFAASCLTWATGNAAQFSPQRDQGAVLANGPAPSPVQTEKIDDSHKPPLDEITGNVSCYRW